MTIAVVEQSETFILFYYELSVTHHVESRHYVHTTLRYAQFNSTRDDSQQLNFVKEHGEHA